MCRSLWTIAARTRLPEAVKPFLPRFLTLRGNTSMAQLPSGLLTSVQSLALIDCEQLPAPSLWMPNVTILLLKNSFSKQKHLHHSLYPAVETVFPAVESVIRFNKNKKETWRLFDEEYEADRAAKLNLHRTLPHAHLLLYRMLFDSPSTKKMIGTVPGEKYTPELAQDFIGASSWPRFEWFCHAMGHTSPLFYPDVLVMQFAALCSDRLDLFPPN